MKKDFKTKILYIIVGIFFGLAILTDYYFFIVQNNYPVYKQVTCNPKNESCFVSDCESNDSTCDQTTTYKKIEVLSKYAGNDYDSLNCIKNTADCKIITCSSTTIETGEKCFK